MAKCQGPASFTACLSLEGVFRCVSCLIKLKRLSHSRWSQKKRSDIILFSFQGCPVEKSVEHSDGHLNVQLTAVGRHVHGFMKLSH